MALNLNKLKKIQIILAVSILAVLSQNVMADNLFATGWGRSFNHSAMGELFFATLEVVGILGCLKTLYCAYRYYKHQDLSQSVLKLCLRFIGSTFLYFSHETMNLIYNSFFI